VVWTLKAMATPAASKWRVLTTTSLTEVMVTALGVVDS
jgi:hypothetical protein